MEIEKKNKFSSIIPGLALSLALCFMLFIYAPYELFLTNRDDFWFTSGQLFPCCAVFFAMGLLICAAAFLIARKISNKLVVFGTALLFWLLISFYVQGNFLVSGLPGLDGSIIDWNAYPAERLKSILCWGLGALLTAALLLILGSRRFHTAAAILGAGLTLILAITLLTLFLTGNSEKKSVLASTDIDLMNMSSQENMIVLHLDAVDACEFEKVIAEDAQFRDDFADFTYFDNAMSGYPYTKCSLGLILTGQWYEGGSRFDDYMDDALEKAPLFKALEERNYRIGLYESGSIYLSQERYEGRISNLREDNSTSDNKREMLMVAPRMTAIKYAPWDFKYKGYYLPAKLFEMRVSKNAGGYDYFSTSNTGIYKRFTAEGAICVDDVNSFKYIMTEGAHVPFQIDADLNFVENGTYDMSIEACISMARALVRQMKAAGVYDHSVIVLMADHGFNEAYDETNLRQHPILLIKGRGEQHEFRTDNAPISYADLQDAFVKLLDGADSSECFDWHEGDARERRFLNYDWRDLTCFEEYIQTGQAEDMGTLKPSGRVFGD